MRSAEVIAQRSLCCRRQVGCVIVTVDNRLCAEGYNGQPPDYQTEQTCGNCGHFFRRHRTDLGPCKVPDCNCEHTPLRWSGESQTGTCVDFCERGAGAAGDYGVGCPSVHAEMNAIAFANWTDTNGGTIYVTTFPCPTCCLLIASARIKRAVYRVAPEYKDRNPQESYDLLRRCGLRVDIVE